ncbi:MAG: hypothetical protein ACRENI_00255 [Gemmatimonadaceae bacterium]
MQRIVLTVILVAAVAGPAGLARAQVLEVPRSTEPAFWGSLGAGLYEVHDVEDGRTQSVWRFGDGLQFRATGDITIRNGTTIGALVGYARLPLVYSGAATGAGSCAGCDAHADVWSAMLLFHLGGNDGFHQVIDVAAGVTRYANFEADASGEQLTPEGDTDLALSIGYGFGYALTPRFAVELVQDFAITLHQDEGLRGDAGRVGQQRTTRLGVRYGLGTRGN